ncbi:MAG: acetylglutamate kinase [Gemmatimonadota bacterium]
MIAPPPMARQRTVAKASVLVEALPFMREHRGKTIVVKYGGAPLEAAPLARSFAEDVALLQSAGIHVVIVHGGGPQLTEVATRLGLETRFVEGLRVTDAETLDVATMVLAGKLNTAVVAALAVGGVPAVGLSGVDGGLLIARRRSDPDLGFVGEVAHVNPGVVLALLDRGFVPVVASIAVDDGGQAYNVNADVVAAELAIGLEAQKLVYLSDVPGVIGPGGDLLSELAVSRAEELLAMRGVVGGGMIPKLRSAVLAIGAGVDRAHLVDGRLQHSLVLELFTQEGIGTMVTADVPPVEPDVREAS